MEEKEIIKTLNDVVEELKKCNLKIFSIQCKNFMKEQIEKYHCLETGALKEKVFYEFKEIEFVKNDDYNFEYYEINDDYNFEYYEILEEIMNGYNTILLKNGTSYVFDKTLEGFEMLFHKANIDEKERDWHDFEFKLGNKYVTLYEMKNKIKGELDDEEDL